MVANKGCWSSALARGSTTSYEAGLGLYAIYKMLILFLTLHSGLYCNSAIRCKEGRDNHELDEEDNDFRVGCGRKSTELVHRRLQDGNRNILSFPGIYFCRNGATLNF